MIVQPELLAPESEIELEGSSAGCACWVAFEEFLVWEELCALKQFTQHRESAFKASGVVEHPDPIYQSHRRSRVLLDTEEFHALIEQRIRFYFPRVLRSLGCQPFDITRVESQITTSNDGDYFKIHNDSSHANSPTRTVTYVYFYHREPKQFQGGELVLYASQRIGHNLVATQIIASIEPVQNTIVFFPSACLHEVTRVRCPSGEFADGRFTINGWLHR